jgi:metal-responsive CopG/Arc/MetJ family transcriptional regulator
MTEPLLRPYPRRTLSISLPDSLLDDIDSFVVMSGAESRSAVIREFCELGLSLHHNPTEAVPLLVDALVKAYESDAESETTA